MKPERYNDIKLQMLDPEHQTQENWRKLAREMLTLIGVKVPKDSAIRHKEISQMLAAAESRRNRKEYGYGAWFIALIDLFEMAEPPVACARPTEEEILASREPGDIRRELAEHYDARDRAAQMQAEKKAEPGA